MHVTEFLSIRERFCNLNEIIQKSLHLQVHPHEASIRPTSTIPSVTATSAVGQRGEFRSRVVQRPVLSISGCPDQTVSPSQARPTVNRHSLLSGVNAPARSTLSSPRAWRVLIKADRSTALVSVVSTTHAAWQPAGAYFNGPPVSPCSLWPSLLSSYFSFLQSRSTMGVRVRHSFFVFFFSFLLWSRIWQTIFSPCDKPNRIL